MFLSCMFDRSSSSIMKECSGWMEEGDGPCWMVRPGATAGWILRDLVCVCVCVCVCILLPF